MAIAGGVLTIMAIIVVPETNPHILLQRRAKKLRKESGNENWHAKKGVEESPSKLLLHSLYRPMKVSSFIRSISFLASYFQSHCIVTRMVSP